MMRFLCHHILQVLFVVPSLYVLMARDRAKSRDKDQAAELTSPSGATISAAALHTPG